MVSAPAVVRSLSAAMLRRKRVLAAAGFGIILGVAWGSCIRAELDEECSRQRAGAPAGSLSIIAWPIDVAMACELINRER
jgi:hypothetical protein